jgi:hypothetical protein
MRHDMHAWLFSVSLMAASACVGDHGPPVLDSGSSTLESGSSSSGGEDADAASEPNRETDDDDSGGDSGREPEGPYDQLRLRISNGSEANIYVQTRAADFSGHPHWFFLDGGGADLLVEDTGYWCHCEGEDGDEALCAVATIPTEVEALAPGESIEYAWDGVYFPLVPHEAWHACIPGEQAFAGTLDLSLCWGADVEADDIGSWVAPRECRTFDGVTFGEVPLVEVIVR